MVGWRQPGGVMPNLPVPVSDDTLEELRDLARDERRSPAAQALVLIEHALRRRRGTRPGGESARARATATHNTDTGSRSASDQRVAASYHDGRRP
jgi:hypothetical protein